MCRWSGQASEDKTKVIWVQTAEDNRRQELRAFLPPLLLGIQGASLVQRIPTESAGLQEKLERSLQCRFCVSPVGM